MIVFLGQSDVRAHPLRAVRRRLKWKIYHALHPNEPLVLNNWYRGMRIALPRSGSAAQVFYRRHSDPEIVSVMEETLRPGDTFVDVGAHIGEYSLVGAALVGSSGVVCAVEPQPRAAAMVSLNASLNGFRNIDVREMAVADTVGPMTLRCDPRSWGGMLGYADREGSLQIQSTTLDDLIPTLGPPTKVRVVKLDAAGAEKAALQGAATVLRFDCAPTLIYKLYNPEVVRTRFGYDIRDIVTLLSAWGFRQTLLYPDRRLPVTSSNCHSLFRAGEYCFPVVAQKHGCE